MRMSEERDTPVASGVDCFAGVFLRLAALDRVVVVAMGMVLSDWARMRHSLSFQARHPGFPFSGSLFAAL